MIDSLAIPFVPNDDVMSDFGFTFIVVCDGTEALELLALLLVLLTTASEDVAPVENADDCDE